MTDKADLIALRDAVQAGKAKHDHFTAAFPDEWPRHAMQAYHDNSVDAALAFLAAVLPGWFWTRQGFVMTVTDDHTGWGSKPHYSARDDHNPARALLLATLNALIDAP